MKKKRHSERLKYVLFSLIPLLVLLLLLEAGGRVLYYHRHSPYPAALWQLVQGIQLRAAQYQVERRAHSVLREMGVSDQEISTMSFGEIWQQYKKMLASPEAEALFEFFQMQYDDYFRQFLQEVEKVDAKLLVLNLSQVPSRRKFFQGLSEKYQVDFLDIAPHLNRQPEHWAHLLPEDGHLSRMGHQIVAEELSRYLEEHSEYRSSVHFESRPALLGDLKSSSDLVWEMNTLMPYRVITNVQGFRRKEDLSFPKTKQRILVLGDSYTFGPFLSNPHPYPNLLDRRFLDKEIINAGIMGYSIPDQLELFQKRAKYAEPDIVVLAVYTNDLSDLSFFKRIAPGKEVKLSEIEFEFFQQIKSRLDLYRE